MNRRRVLYGGKEEELYEGFEYNCWIYGNDTTFSIIPTPQEGYVVSPIYEMSKPLPQLTVRFGHKTNYVGLNCFIDNKNNPGYVYVASNGDADTVRTVVPTNAERIRVTFSMAELDNCYIYNKTAGEYIFKGKNVK